MNKASLISRKDAKELMSLLVKDIKYIAKSNEVETNMIKKISIVLDFLKKANDLAEEFEIIPPSINQISKEDQQIIDSFLTTRTKYLNNNK